jgi:hypothetical protein
LVKSQMRHERICSPPRRGVAGSAGDSSLTSGGSFVRGCFT